MVRAADAAPGALVAGVLDRARKAGTRILGIYRAGSEVVHKDDE